MMMAFLVNSSAHARARRAGEDDAVVDLVGDELHVRRVAELAERLELVGREHRARRVGGRAEDEALDRRLAGGGARALRRRELGRRHVVVLVDGQREQLHAVALQEVAVARVARRRHRDNVARVEGGVEGDRERAAAARREVDARRRDVDAVVGLVHLGERGAERRLAARRRVAAAVGRHLLGRGGDGRLRRRRLRLADLEVVDLLARARERVGFGDDVHHLEGADAGGAAGGVEGHFAEVRGRSPTAETRSASGKAHNFRCLFLHERADLDDAGGLVVRAADEVEAVGQQRQGGHRCLCGA